MNLNLTFILHPLRSTYLTYDKNLWEKDSSVVVAGLDGAGQEQFELFAPVITRHLFVNPSLIPRYGIHAVKGTYDGQPFNNEASQDHVLTIGEWCLMVGYTKDYQNWMQVAGIHSNY